ncbi:MAG: SAM-dependent DNA methyltransferase [Candidatus Marinimicrobia bacterium]|nr:SAM-dependent DNA methyltransferase [Candidatus Neomarinimicrobiota bacterium]
MRSKIKSKPTRIPSPFGTSAHKTERTGVAILMHWMREIIENKNLDLGSPDVETIGDDRKMPDTVIYESRRSQNILCVIEAKQPYYDVFDEKDLKEPAREKASKRKAKYFALTNFKKLIWYNTEKVNALKPEEEQIVEKYTLSELEDLDYIEQTRYSETIKRGLEDFLTKLYSVYSGKEAEPKQAIDEFLIFRLQEKIRVLSTYYRRIIDDQCHKDPSFAKKLKYWFVDQGWSFAWQPQDFDKVARQTAYLFVNKILFYNLLQAKRPQELAPLELPEGLLKGSQLRKILQSFFDEVLKVDYETIYTTDFIDTIAFPEAKEVIKEIKELVKVLQRYDFSKLGYDVIGRIFERLIPQNERHNLGQYFTSPDVVDLILRFCLYHEDSKILDPACGAGTFLVRAYQHKKLMNQRLEHERILETLWGNDIAKFPAHLATINLAINDLGVDKNYPNILQEDFFSLLVGDEGFDPEKWRKVRAKTLGLQEREVTYPRWFDAIVGNPPYTRQEEISEISPKDAEYKKKLIKKALLDLGGKKIAEIGKRAGIHAYFFVHGTKFLKEGGFFGFIVSNSWMDVDYGKGFQEFFLKNYKIVAVIESKVERWFEEADINTCIIILKKCKNKKERDENLLRFVYLKKPLRHFIPPAQDMWEKQKERLDAIDKLKKTILAHNDFYENEELKILPKSQKELWDEGFDPDEKKYVGAKWGKYLRAPEIFFKILEKCKGKLVPLKQIADVRFGIKTGVNEFFYLDEEEIKRRGIEKEFWMHKDEKGNWVPNYVIKSPRECKSIVVNPKDLKFRVLMIHKDRKYLKGTNVLKYIKEGERKGFDKRPTCASRKRWYDLGIRHPGTILWEMIHFERLKAPWNGEGVFVDHNLFEILPKSRDFSIVISGQLNCTIFGIFRELWGRVNLGQGSLKTEGIDIEKFPILNFAELSKANVKKIEEVFKKFSQRIITLSIFDELSASTPEEVSLNKIKPDRRELDKLIMGEILGLTDDEQLEVYRAVIDLVKSRIEKAKSFGKKKKTQEGIDVDAFVKTVMDNVGEETLGKFYREKVLSQKSLLTKTLPKVSGVIKIEQHLFGWQLSSRKQYIECHTEDIAHYLKVFLEAGLEKVKVPKNEDYLNGILSELEVVKTRIDNIINSYLESIVSTKTREMLRHKLWSEIIK